MTQFQPSALACFDFDGTLTRRDTMLVFSRFVHRGVGWYARMLRLAPTLAGYALHLIRNDVAKQRFLTVMFAGMAAHDLELLGGQFCQTRLPGLLRPAMMEQLHWHQLQGHVIMLVTASLPFWTRAFARAEGMILVSSEPEITNGKFTGKLLGLNCYANQKVVNIEKIWNINFPKTEIPFKRYAYGDSRGDQEMLQWADVHGKYAPSTD